MLHEPASGGSVIPAGVVHACKVIGFGLPLEVLDEALAVCALVQCTRHEAFVLLEPDKTISSVEFHLRDSFCWSVNGNDHGADAGGFSDDSHPGPRCSVSLVIGAQPFHMINAPTESGFMAGAGDAHQRPAAARRPLKEVKTRVDARSTDLGKKGIRHGHSPAILVPMLN